MFTPQQVIAANNQRVKERTGRVASAGVIRAVISDAKEFFAKLTATAIDRLVSHTLKVNVENQVTLPEVQQIDGSVSVKEMKALLLGVEQVRKSIQDLQKLDSTIRALSTTLKPVAPDFTPLQEAIEGIEIPEVKIPEYPTSIEVSNLKDLKKSFDELGKKLNITFPEVTIPAYPKEIKVSNLSDFPLPAPVAPVVNVDMASVTKALKKLQEGIDELIAKPFPIQKAALSSYERSMTMQAEDIDLTIVWKTLDSGEEVIDYREFTSGDGVTHRRTHSYSDTGKLTGWTWTHS